MLAFTSVDVHNGKPKLQRGKLARHSGILAHSLSLGSEVQVSKLTLQSVCPRIVASDHRRTDMLERPQIPALSARPAVYKRQSPACCTICISLTEGIDALRWSGRLLTRGRGSVEAGARFGASVSGRHQFISDLSNFFCTEIAIRKCAQQLAKHAMNAPSLVFEETVDFGMTSLSEVRARRSAGTCAGGINCTRRRDEVSLPAGGLGKQPRPNRASHPNYFPN